VKRFDKKKSRTVGDNETFVNLMRVAREDPDIRRVILNILTQSSFNRHSMLNTLIAELKLKSAPDDFIEAFASLLDDEVARRASELLKETDDQH
jgi:hypothetical protein